MRSSVAGPPRLFELDGAGIFSRSSSHRSIEDQRNRTYRPNFWWGISLVLTIS